MAYSCSMAGIVAKVRSQASDRAHARTYLGKANEFLAVARLAQAGRHHDAALLLAIHSGISSGDAVTVALAGLHSKDPDHLKAADLLESIAARSEDIRARATQLRSLLKMKNTVEYEERRTTSAEAADGLKRAERLAAWAAAEVTRARL